MPNRNRDPHAAKREHNKRLQEKNADKLFARRLRQIRNDREATALANAENLTPHFDRIRKQNELKKQAARKPRPATAMARLFGETIPKRPPAPVPTMFRKAGTFTSTRRREPGGDAIGLGAPPRSLPGPKEGVQSLRHAETKGMVPRQYRSAGWQDPRKATSTYRAFKGFEYSQQVPLARPLTNEEKRVKSVNDNLRRAVYSSGRPSSPVTQQLMRDSESAEHIERLKTSHVSGYQAHYASVGKLNPEAPWACNQSSACRNVPEDTRTNIMEISDKPAQFLLKPGHEIPEVICMPCSNKDVKWIKAIQLKPEIAAEQQRQKECLEAERDFQAMKKRLASIGKKKVEEEKPTEVTRYSTSMRGSCCPMGKMYTIGTSR